jgi:hypothetical protein
MESKIILIEHLAATDTTEIAYRTWSPVLEKALIDYCKISEKSKKFLCRFCHERSLIESSELQSDTGIMNILSPSGKPTDIKSTLPFIIKILGDVVISLDGLVNFHISSMPNCQYVNINDGLLRNIHTVGLTVNQTFDLGDDFKGTNWQEVYESLFINKSKNVLMEAFKKHEDVFVYPAWHLNEIITTDAGIEPKNVMRLSGRFNGIEREVETPPEEVKTTFAGYWEIGGIDSVKVYLINKPKSFNRFMFKLLLGIIWINNDNKTAGHFNG